LKVSLRLWTAVILLFISACSTVNQAVQTVGPTRTAVPTPQSTAAEVLQPTEAIRISPTFTPTQVNVQEDPTSTVTPVVLPFDVPVMPDAEAFEIGDGKVVYFVDASIDAVDRFYQEKMPTKGWVLSYRSSLPPGKCLGGNCTQTSGSNAASEPGLVSGLGQIWVKAGASMQVMLVEEKTGTLVTINMFSE
jgi:hypothetical protein